MQLPGVPVGARQPARYGVIQNAWANGMLKP
jgi:hypothetical protein